MASINDLANEITRELQRYANIVEEDMEVTKEKVANDLVNELKQKSPKNTGKYGKDGGKRLMVAQLLFIMH